jgi:hypothetical protein
MRPIGFSTGALAYADFRRALRMLEHKEVQAVELSALREAELIPLLEAIPSLDLSRFDYVSIHAPSQYDAGWERALCELIDGERVRGWPIVLHPDAVRDFGLWRELGELICIENMDKRKPIGRSARELAGVFAELPDATFCFDIGHARQFDPTMTEAWLILREFGSKIRQVHVSEVNTRSKHDRLSYASTLAFQEVAHLIPESIPLILETPVNEVDIEAEIASAREALPVKRKTMAA